MIRVALLLLILLAPTASWAEPGNLFLVGGGERGATLSGKFIELAGGKDALIVIVPTASEEADTGARYVREFKACGCTRVRALTLGTRAQAQRGAWEPLLREAQGIWFTGGDQSKLMRVIGGTPFEAAVRAAYARGATVGGTSAGTACQSSLMLTGNAPPDVIRDDSRALGTGIGLFRGVILDQHFVKRQRLNRLLAVVAMHPDHVGVGIDESTALWRKPDGTLEVLGLGVVVIVDATAAQVKRAGAGALGARDVRVHLLLPGETYRLP